MNFSENQIKLAGASGEEDNQREFAVGLDMQGEGIRLLDSDFGDDENADEQLAEDLSACNANSAALQDDLTDCEADLVTCAEDYDVLEDAMTNTFEDLYPPVADQPDDSTGDGRFSFINLYPRTSNIRAGFCQAYIYQQANLIYLHLQWSPSGRPYGDTMGGFNVFIGGNRLSSTATSIGPSPAAVSFNMSSFPPGAAVIGTTYTITATAFSRCETCGPGGFARQETLPLGGSGLITVTGVSPYVVNIETNFSPLIDTAF